MTVLVLNGPNLGRLGVREPDVYGTATYADLVARCEAVAVEVGLDVEVRQTDDEAEMIGWLHEAADTRSPVVLNAGAWTHTSVAVRDAASQLTEPLIEVHLSNVHAREPFRHTSYISDIAAAVVVGMGLDGYAAALRHLGSDSGGS
ncbi:MAG: type II 3-dehydroquinate dehydratase [Aeromicrobium sp.]|uniref:type II 3-dehydroquinate dehydratase n=1 Tax=Aeromicrobium sp. TaxID=1871063 RepID=UPI003C694E7A